MHLGLESCCCDPWMFRQTAAKDVNLSGTKYLKMKIEFLLMCLGHCVCLLDLRWSFFWQLIENQDRQSTNTEFSVFTATLSLRSSSQHGTSLRLTMATTRCMCVWGESRGASASVNLSDSKHVQVFFFVQALNERLGLVIQWFLFLLLMT